MPAGGASGTGAVASATLRQILRQGSQGDGTRWPAYGTDGKAVTEQTPTAQSGFYKAFRMVADWSLLLQGVKQSQSTTASRPDPITAYFRKRNFSGTEPHPLVHRDYGGFGYKGRTSEIKDPSGPKGLKHLHLALCRESVLTHGLGAETRA